MGDKCVSSAIIKIALTLNGRDVCMFARCENKAEPNDVMNEKTNVCSRSADRRRSN